MDERRLLRVAALGAPSLASWALLRRGEKSLGDALLFFPVFVAAGICWLFALRIVSAEARGRNAAAAWLLLLPFLWVALEFVVLFLG